MVEAANSIKKYRPGLLQLQEQINATLKRAIKYVTAKTVQPLVRRYVAKQRVYSYKGIALQVPQTVFHPGLFFSTRMLWKFIERLNLKNKTFLELGAGSGLIALNAARCGAKVTATDVNRTAVEYLHKNKRANGISIDVIWSDLFDNIPKQPFDIIAINPPYYKKNPANDAELAWYCGENGEYFHKLFETLGDYAVAGSEVYMILCEGCDIDLIKRVAATNGFRFVLMQQKQTLMEMNYIFRIYINAYMYA